jgi:hypothetical protein
MAVGHNFALAECGWRDYHLNHADGIANRLTSRVWVVCSAQPLERSNDHMRNKITQLIIVVVPWHTAGGG